MKGFTATILTVILASCFFRSSQAVPIDVTDFVNPTVIDFDSLSTGTLQPGGANPFPDVTITGYVTGAHGQAPFSGNELRSGFPIGIDDIIRVDFSVPVHRVGAYAYAPGAFAGETSVLTIRAYDTALHILDEFSVLPTYVPDYYDADSPGFLGLETPIPIFRVEFISSASGFDTFPGIDLFRYEAVPEPYSLLLLSVGALLPLVAHLRTHQKPGKLTARNWSKSHAVAAAQ